jgi:hypothetical protein
VLRRRGRSERIAAFLEAGGYTDQAEKWQVAHSDAGEYLLGLATTNERISRFQASAERVRQSLERGDVWEESYEWRMATDGTDRLERLGEHAFRSVVTHHGEFSLEAHSFPIAYEALRVLSSLQKDLFYAVGWSSWAGPRRMEPKDPVVDRTWDSDHGYLKRIAKAAIAEAPRSLSYVEQARVEGGDWEDHVEVDGRVIHRRFAAAEVDWAREPILELSVESGAFVTRCETPTSERALEFGGIFARLHRDIPAVLGWG